MLEAGTYAAQLVQVQSDLGPLWAQFGFSSKNRTPQVILTFRVDGGQLVQWTGFFTEATRERTERDLRTVGFVGDDIDAFNDQNPHGTVNVVTEVEEYKGAKRARVKFINSGAFTVASGDRMSKDDLKKLSAQIKADKAKRQSGFDPNADIDDRIGF